MSLCSAVSGRFLLGVLLERVLLWCAAAAQRLLARSACSSPPRKRARWRGREPVPEEAPPGPSPLPVEPGVVIPAKQLLTYHECDAPLRRPLLSFLPMCALMMELIWTVTPWQDAGISTNPWPQLMSDMLAFSAGNFLLGNVMTVPDLFFIAILVAMRLT